MEKKTGEFLLDTQLGEKKYELKTEPAAAAESAVKLNIEGATPVSLLETVKRGNIFRRIQVKGWYAKIDEQIRAMGKVKAKDTATFFRLLAVMLNAGMPLVRSLDVISDQTLNSKLKKTIFEIARTIERGGALSGGMTSYPDVFSESQVGMVKSGEASGQLNKILLDLALEVEKIAGIQKKIKGALIYPAFIFVVLIAVVTGMLIFVVPKIAEIFASASQELPLITRIVLKASDIVKNYWYLIALCVAAVFGTPTLSKKVPALRRPFDEFLIHIPIFGDLIRKSILARFARSLGNLIKSGVPIIQSLQINAKGLGNEVYKERVLLAAEDLARGIPLGESLRDSPLFPPLLVQMIVVGEQTAQLDTVTAKIADYYEEEVDIAVQGFTKVLEPVIIVLVGASVGTIVAAIMLPIIQLVSVSEAL